MKIRRILTLRDGRVPPAEFRLVPMGAYETTKGTFFLTPDNAARIIARLEDDGVDCMMDWEHESVAKDQPSRADAAGWFNVELRSDGLWAVNVRWQADALEALSTGKYRYFSPAFAINEKTNEITDFINCALTNMPATKRCEPLVAASKKPLPTRGNTMHKKFLAALAQHMKANKMDHAAATKKCGMDTAKMMAEGAQAPSQEEMTKCAKALGFSMESEDGEEDTETASAMDNHDLDQTENTGAEDSDADEPGGPEGKKKTAAGDTVDVPGEDRHETASKEFSEALVTLTGTSNLSKAKGVLAGWKAKAMAYDKDHETLMKLTKEREEERRSVLTEKGKTEGKLTPSLIKLFSKKPVEELEAFLDHAPVITGAEVHQVEAGTPIANLKKEDREVAMLLSRDPAEVAKGIEDERNGTFERQILASYSERPKKTAAK